MTACTCRVIVVALLLGPLAACGGYDDMLYRIVSKEDDAYARAYFDSVRAGRIDYAMSRLSPKAYAIPGVRDSIVALGRYLPAGPLDSMHLIGANRFRTASVDRTNFTYEYHSAEGWGAASVTVVGELGIRYVDAISLTKLERSLEDANSFTFHGKTAGHYLILALLTVCVGASFSVAILALRTPMPRRWLWALLALVGVTSLWFNWTNGAAGLELLTVHLFGGASVRAGPAAPWILKVFFPIGALMTWRRIQQARQPAPTADTPPSAPPSDIPAQQQA